MTNPLNDYIKHFVNGRTYTTMDGNHIAVTITTDQEEIANGIMKTTETETVWFMDVGDDQVMYSEECNEENITPTPREKIPDELLEDIEDEFDVTVVEDVTDISIPTKTYTLSEKVDNLPQGKMRDYIIKLGGVTKEGYDRVDYTDNKSFGITLFDGITGKQIDFSKHNKTFTIKFNEEGKEPQKYTPTQYNQLVEDVIGYLITE